MHSSSFASRAVLLAACFGVVATGPAWSQGRPEGREAPELLRDVRVAARTTPDSLTVGDHVTLEVRVQAPAGMQVRFPERTEPNGPVDLVGVQVESPQAGDKKGDKKATASGPQSWVAHYTLAVFRVGELALAPWPIEVRADSLYAIATTDSIRLHVESVLTDSLAAADLRDLKPQAKLALTPWPWILAGIALLVAIAVFVWWWRRRHRPLAPVVALPAQRPAHEMALDALRRLESQRLPLDGKFGEHYVRLSEILRRYLEDGFTVPALEETTEGILLELDRRGFDRQTLNQVGALCAEADLVKFAKHEPTIEECIHSLGRVRDFVLATAARSALATPARMPALADAGAADGGASPPAASGGARA